MLVLIVGEGGQVFVPRSEKYVKFACRAYSSTVVGPRHFIKFYGHYIPEFHIVQIERI